MNPRLALPCLALLVAVAALGPGCSREPKKEQARRRAAAAFKAGNLEAARLEFQNVLQIDPNDAGAMEQLGLVWLERGASMRALPLLFRATELDPTNRDARLKFLRLALDAGKLADVRRGALTVLEQHPRNDTALALLAEAIKGAADYEAALLAWREFPDKLAAGYHIAAGHLALYRGDTDAARAAFQQAAAIEPQSASAHSTAATFFLGQRNAAAAGKSLQAAAGLAPARSLARLRWIEFRYQTGATADALADLESVSKAAPDYFPAWCLRAQFAALEKKPDEALAHLQRVFALDPANYEARITRAQLQLARGEPEPAIGDLEKLTEEFPQFPLPPFLLGQAYLQAKNPEKAQAALLRALAQNPDHEPAIIGWAQIAMRRGEHEAVAKAMAEVLTRRPLFAPAQGLFLDALAGLGRYDEITRILEASLRQQPDHPPTHFLLGMVAMRQQRPADARQHFERALQLAPSFYQAFAEIIRLDLSEGAVAQAAAKLQPALKGLPEFGPLHLLAATVYARLNRWADTEAAATKALALGCGDAASAYELLGRSIDATRTRAETLAWLEALRPKPEDKAAALITAGGLYHKHGEFTRARDAYEESLKLQPDALPALNNLAVLQAERLGNLDRAHALATRARELAPALPEIADTLGWITLKRGDPARALELLKESAAKLPADPAIQFHLARAHHLLGQAGPARAAYRAAAAAPAEFEGKSEIAGYLAELDRAAR